ncbi:MAG: nitroreductase family protein [Planctomycetes bacterium]|nr:nitroreductase family protein [Planctomycetota bacterium]
MDVYEAIATRKSIREWQDKDIPDEVLERVMEAARLAPSAKNLQEWRFIAVRDKDLRERLVPAAAGQAFVGAAPVVLVCCADTDNHLMRCGQLCYPIDVAIAMDHLSLAAVSEGLGTCWIGAFYEDQVKSILGIPEHIRVVELMPIGYPAKPDKVDKIRLPLDEIMRKDRW